MLILMKRFKCPAVYHSAWVPGQCRHCDKPCNRQTLCKTTNPTCDKHYKVTNPLCDKPYKATNPIFATNTIRRQTLKVTSSLIGFVALKESQPLIEFYIFLTNKNLLQLTLLTDWTGWGWITLGRVRTA